MPGLEDPYIPRMTNLGGGGGQSSISDAFASFNDGLRNFQASRSLNQAKEQLQGIQQQEGSDSSKRMAQSQLAQALGSQFLSLGLPASYAQTAMHSFAPTPRPIPQNEAELAFYQASGDPIYKEAANNYSQIKQSDAAAKASAKATSSDPTQSLNTELKEVRRDKIVQDQLTKLSDKIDVAKASSRSALGRLETSLTRLQEAKTGLLSDPQGTLNKLSTGELAQVMSSVFTGGIGTVSGTEHLIPQTLNQKITDTKNYLSSGLQPYNIPQVQKGYNDIMDRLLSIVPAQQNELMKNTMKAELSLAKRKPDDFSNIAEARITNPDGSRDKAYLKNGRVRFNSDDQMDELEEGAKWVMQNSSDAKAQQVFNGIKENPYYMQALQRNPTFKKLLIGAGKSLQGGN